MYVKQEITHDYEDFPMDYYNINDVESNFRLELFGNPTLASNSGTVSLLLNVPSQNNIPYSMFTIPSFKILQFYCLEFHFPMFDIKNASHAGTVTAFFNEFLWAFLSVIIITVLLYPITTIV